MAGFTYIIEAFRLATIIGLGELMSRLEENSSLFSSDSLVLIPDTKLIPIFF
jgi:hypothetical protein